MAKSSRIEVRVSQDLKERVEEMADRLGQTTTVFVERALEAALAKPEVTRAPVPAGAFDAAKRAATAPTFNRVTSLKR